MKKKRITLSKLTLTKIAITFGVNQDQTAQKVLSDPSLLCPPLLLHNDKNLPFLVKSKFLHRYEIELKYLSVKD